MQRSSTDDNTLKLVQQWIEQCVIDLSFCPFAGAPYRAGRVRLSLCDEFSESGFYRLIETELVNLLDGDERTETTLIIGSAVFGDFLNFNDFLGPVEALLAVDDRADQIQMASFHPDYRFEGVDANDVGNYTNRAPFPIVQWLRTDSVARAVGATDTLAIPDANINKLRSMSEQEVRERFPWLSDSGTVS